MKIKAIIFGVMIICMISSCGVSDNCEESISIYNQRESAISELYLTPAKADGWGENLIEKYNKGYNLGSDSEIWIPLEYFQDTYYNLMLIDLNGMIFVCDNINFQGQYGITICERRVEWNILNEIGCAPGVNCIYYASEEVNIEREMELLDRYIGGWKEMESGMFFEIGTEGEWEQFDQSENYIMGGIYKYDGRNIYLYDEDILVEKMSFDHNGLYAQMIGKYLLQKME